MPETRRQGVLLVHGIGDQKPDWAAAIIPEFLSRVQAAAESLHLGGASPDPEQFVAIQAAHWAEILEVKQRVLSDILRHSPDLVELRGFWPWEWWRRAAAWFRRKERGFVAGYLGDVVGYRAPGAYVAIQEALLTGLETLASQMGARGPTGTGIKRPLTIVAHSLGCVVASDFLWDRTKARATEGEIGFHPTFFLRNLFTVGSPLALFSLSFGGPEVFNQPVKVESDDGRWVNIYDRDDPVAMPLKPLNSAYDRVVLADARVQAGLYLVAHDGYFRNGPCLDAIARKLVLDWAVDNAAVPAEQLARWARTYDESLLLGDDA